MRPFVFHSARFHEQVMPLTALVGLLMFQTGWYGAKTMDKHPKKMVQLTISFNFHFQFSFAHTNMLLEQRYSIF